MATRRAPPSPGGGAGDAPRPPRNKDRSTVVMVEPLTAVHAVDGAGGGPVDVRPLLRLMDICTCASAERHTRVNCVTASCGDIVFEYVPRCGELLELTATPVHAGRTSLDVGLNVVAVGDGGARRFVCCASFTYVTTRDEGGNKRMCPPLCREEEAGGGEDGGDGGAPEIARWERTVARHRRALVRTEMASSSPASDGDVGAGSGFDLEFTEVVLPAHLNHMQHTFGGVVMGWMCKAALAEASRASRRRVGALQIRSVTRVEFASGSDVSNHLVFRPRLNAVFDDARSAEVEVRVSRRSIETGLETHMNTGYFYVAGADSGRAFASSPDFCSGADVGETAARRRVMSDATWRRRLLLARRNLLGGLGEAVEWHPALQDEAPLLTLLSVLRLIHHSDGSVKWTRLLRDEDDTALGRQIGQLSTLVLGGSGVRDFEIEVARSQWLGSKETFVLRARGEIPNARVGPLFELIKDRRPEWDELCASVRPIEEKVAPDGDNNTDEICWDIVQHTALTPAKAMLLGYACACVTGSLPRKDVPICLLRAWKAETEGDAIYVSRSVRHPEAECEALLEVLPSGWFLRPLGDGVLGGTSVTYVVEHDLCHFRRLMPTLTDEVIIDIMAKAVRKWFTTIESIAANDAGYGSIT